MYTKKTSLLQIGPDTASTGSVFSQKVVPPHEFRGTIIEKVLGGGNGFWEGDLFQCDQALCSTHYAYTYVVVSASGCLLGPYEGDSITHRVDVGDTSHEYVVRGVLVCNDWVNKRHWSQGRLTCEEDKRWIQRFSHNSKWTHMWTTQMHTCTHAHTQAMHIRECHIFNIRDTAATYIHVHTCIYALRFLSEKRASLLCIYEVISKFESLCVYTMYMQCMTGTWGLQ